MDWYRYYIRGLADLVLPRECAVCRRPLGIMEEHLCIYCMADLPLTYYWMQSRNPMSDKLNELVGRDIVKGVRNNAFEPYSYAAALFFYNSEAGFRHITHRLKYGGDMRIGRFFGRIAGKKIFESALFKDADLLVPVPLHWSRSLHRGYNQAAVIAEGISDISGIRKCCRLMTRTRRTMTQTILHNDEKAKNVENAFTVHRGIAERLNPGHILLIDDVFTTGATANACHRALRNFFGPDVRISTVTLGYVGSI